MSKIGVIFLVIYLAFTAWVVYDSFTCGDVYCDYIALVSIMPWPLFLKKIKILSFLDSSAGYFVFVFLNSVIIYVLGLLLGKLFIKIKSYGKN